MQKKCPNPFPLTFHHSKHNPQTLIMLTPFQPILSKMFIQTETKYLWIDKKPCHKIIGRIQQQLDLGIVVFGDRWEVEDYMEDCRRRERDRERDMEMEMEENQSEKGDQEERKQKQKQEYILICPIQAMVVMEDLMKRKEVLGGVFFSFKNRCDDDQNQEDIMENHHEGSMKNTQAEDTASADSSSQFSDSQSQIQSEPESQPQHPSSQSQSSSSSCESPSQKKTHFAKSQPQLLNTLKSWTRNQKKSIQKLNFLHITSDVWSSNLMARTILAMIYQDVDQHTRQGLVAEMRRDMGKVAEEVVGMRKFGGKVEEFFGVLEKRPLQQAQAIKWYTQQSPIYKFINNLLRSTQNPTQLYHIQPYLKDLFKAIQNRFKTCQNSQNPKKFTTCRGGTISQHQVKQFIRNKGGIVQNLGFFSTSIDYQTCLHFMTNVFFQVTVDQQKGMQMGMGMGGYPGYAEVADLSNYGEGEILFNPMNFFRVIDVKKKYVKKVEAYYIILQYEFFHNLSNKPQTLLTPSQKLFKNFLHHQNSFLQTKICQGNSLTRLGQNLQHSQQYWKKYYQISTTYEDKVNGLIHLTISEINRGFQRKGMLIGLYLLRVVLGHEENWQKRKRYMTQGLREMEQMEQMEEMKEMKEVEDMDQEEIGNLISLEEFLLNFQDLNFEQILERIMETVEQFNEKGLGKQNRIYIQILTILASTTTNTTNSTSSLTLFQLPQKYFKSQSPESPTPKYASILQSMAKAHKKLKNLDHALSLSKECLQIRLNTLGQLNPEHATCLNHIAEILWEKGEFEEAGNMVRECLEIRERVLGKLHPQYVVALDLEARIWVKKGQSGKALEVQKQCCELSEKVFGQHHLNYPRNLTTLANIYTSLQDHQTSITLHKKSLTLTLQILPNPHPEHSTILQNLARSYLSQGDYKKSLQTYQQFLQLHGKIDDPNQITYAESLIAMGTVCMNLGQDNRALQVFEDARRIVKRVLGGSCCRYGEVLHCIGRIHHRFKSYERALEIYEESKLIFLISQGGTKTPHYPAVLLDIGLVNQDQHLYTKALESYQKSKQILTQNHGKSSYETVIVLKNIANILALKKQPENALALYEECLQIVDMQKKGTCERLKAELLTCKAEIQVGLGRVDQGLRIYERCERIWVWAMGTGSQGYLKTLNCIANTYKIIGNYAQALHYVNKSLKTLQTFKPIPPLIHIKCLQQKAQILSQLSNHKCCYKISNQICQQLYKTKFNPNEKNSNIIWYEKKRNLAKNALNNQLAKYGEKRARNYLDFN